MLQPIFKGLVIAVGGTFPNLKQADLKSLIVKHGASFSATVGDDCTHLVTTEKDVEKESTKYKQALALSSCRVVALSWLIESDKAGRRLQESLHTFYCIKTPASQADGVSQDNVLNGIASEDADNKRTTRRRVATQNSNQDTCTGTIKETQKNGADGATVSADDKKPASKKRSKAEEPTEDKPQKKIKDIQKTSAKTLNVPVDEGFAETGKLNNPKVYIDDAGLIWDGTLSQTVASSNANKFYRVQLLVGANSKYMTWTRWGRVGERGQSACLGDGTLKNAMVHFEKKFKDKSGLKWADRLNSPKFGKYTFLERNYEEDDDEENKPTKKEKVINKEEDDKPQVESVLPKSLQDLMAFIFNLNNVLSTLAAMSYDANKMPLGKLSERTMKSGFLVLKEISEIMATPTLAQERYSSSPSSAIETLSNQYFSLIPHVFGRNRPPRLNSNTLIKKEVELLEALMDMDVANEIMKEAKDDDEIHELDRQFQSLGMEEMTELDRESTEFQELESYLQNSRGNTHHMNYKVINIFRIARQGEKDRFNASPYANIPNSDRRLLWHGSRSTNFGGILSQGLRIAPPEAPVNGYMYGKGVYLADTSSKSANYCCHYNSGGVGLLLLCEAELGSPMLELDGADYNAGDLARKQGKIATLGMGTNVPGGWKDAGCLNPALQGVKMPDTAAASKQDDGSRGLYYNEYIVYDVAQIQQRYLFQVKMN